MRPRLATCICCFVLVLLAGGFANAQSYSIDLTGHGAPFYPEIAGQNILTAGFENSDNASLRGPSGGLDADTYDWKSHQGVSFGGTGAPRHTLDFLRAARDRNATPLFTANARGYGQHVNGNWVYDYVAGDPAETPVLAQDAADWVRYVNFTLQNYDMTHQPVAASTDGQLLQEIDWQDPALPGAGEAALPQVTYWEIGNEPNIHWPAGHYMNSQAYSTRYAAIAAAMKAVDPTIKVGPVATTLHPGEANPVRGVLQSDAPVDFVSYHPYGVMNWAWYGSASGQQQLLRETRSFHQSRLNDLKSVVAADGRDPDAIEYIASEWSSVEHRNGPWQSSMLAALGNAETLFAFADLNIRMAQVWAEHNEFWWDGTPYATYHLYEAWNEHLGDEVVYDIHDEPGFDPETENHRLYVTRDSGTGDISVWALNFDDDDDVVLDLEFLDLAPGEIVAITQMILDDTDGPGGLKARNHSDFVSRTSGTNVDTSIRWTETNLTDTIDLANFDWTIPNASIGLLVIDVVPEPSTFVGMMLGLSIASSIRLRNRFAS